MQNKSLFESPPSLFVPNGQRLSSPSPTKDSSDAEFSSLSNPLQLPPPGHKASKSLASKTRSRRSNGRCRDRSFHSACVRGVGGVCLCATPVGAISALSEPPNSSVQHNRSLPPAANGEQLSTWLERRRGGRRAPLLFLFPTPSTPTPIPPLSQPLSESPPFSSSSSSLLFLLRQSSVNNSRPASYSGHTSMDKISFMDEKL